MHGTMLDVPLLVSRILDHAAERHSTSKIIGFDGDLRPHTTRFDVVAGRAAATAHALVKMGVEQGDVVGVLSGNRNEAVEALFAISSMGAVAMPLNILQPRQFIRSVLEEHEVAVLFVDPALSALATEVCEGVASLQHLVVMGSEIPEDVASLTANVPTLEASALESALDGQSTTYAWPELDERTAAVIAHTSGTTGTAKAVEYTHRSIWLHSMQMCTAESAALHSSDTLVTTVPIFHVMSWGAPYAAFMSGTTLVLARPGAEDSLLTGKELAGLLATYRPNKLATTPAAMHLLLRRLETHPQSIRHLREVLVGGSAMSPALYDAFAERHGVAAMQAYGLTESSPLATVARPDPHSSATHRRSQMLGQGRFPAAVQARLVDAGQVQPHDGWSVGELQLRGPWVTAGYLGDPDDDQDQFDSGWLRTGDMATISPKGYLDIIDRVDDIILSGGEWISSVELENAVMVDDRVADAAVVGVPDNRWGNRPLVLVQLKPGVNATARALWESLESSVDQWKRPDHWAFVSMIPRTSVGKFNKRHIRSAHAAGEYMITTISPEPGA